MQSEERFRNALGGYNKEDVNRYIKETDLANAARLDTLQKQMDELSENLDKARRENEELTTANEETTVKLADAHGQIAEKDTALD